MRRRTGSTMTLAGTGCSCRCCAPASPANLSAAEWRAIGEAGFAATPNRARLAVFGMFMYEGDPAVLRAMLAPAPAGPRLLLPLAAPRAYARLCRRVHGTPRP